MHWREILKTPPQPEKEKVEKEEQKINSNATRLSQFPPWSDAAAATKYQELPSELSHLIEVVGQLYKADQDDIDDMKSHVLQFINTESNGLLIALNGFRQLANEFAS